LPNPADSNPYQVDRRLLRRAFDRVITGDRECDKVCQLVADSLLERLTLLRGSPDNILLLDGSAYEHRLLRQRYPAAQLIVTHLSHARLHAMRRASGWFRARPMTVCCDVAQQMPFADDGFDLIVGNLTLPWVFPAERFATELNRLLKKDGAFFLSAAGPDTLIELREACAELDDATHVNAFPDMHDLADLLLRAGLADPVVDAERVTLSYSNYLALQQEMRDLGYICALASRRRGLYGRDYASRVQAMLERGLNDQQQRLPISLELVFAHGWKGTVQTGAPEDSGSVRTVPLKDMRGR